ncbi:MAG: hypothetical protein LBF00_02395 [Mycoplasmataceae bacterium]|nr:hypothetical protein [Mycoplasmataceae bacterium]
MLQTQLEPKYAMGEHVDAKINEVKQEMLIFKQDVNNKFNEVNKNIFKLRNAVNWILKKLG